MATVGPEPELPPLTVEETERIIGRIASVVEEHHLVLIGGQAVALWRAQLAAYVPAGAYTVTSRDVDLQGSRRALDSIAELLDGRLRVPSFDDHTPLVGVVLRSRVAKSALPGKQTERAAQQLEAAIALVPAYGRMLLDHDADPRLVTNMNESVFRLAHDDPRAMRVYLAGQADVAAAALDDSRLPRAHREMRLPQLRAQLATERERHASRVIESAPQPPTREQSQDRSCGLGT